MPSQSYSACYNRQQRAERVAVGRCGYCGAKRHAYKWLCDDCAAAHRERQRQASLCRIAATWISPIASIMEQRGLSTAPACPGADDTQSEERTGQAVSADAHQSSPVPALSAALPSPKFPK